MRRTTVPLAQLDHSRLQGKNYFGDLIRQLTGESAKQTIRRFLMQRARALLISGSTVAETADQLGFEHPQHFTRLFKKFTGVTPTEFLGKA